MSDLELDWRNALANDAIIGPLVLDVSGEVRIYPDALKQEANFPALTYERISTVRNEKVGSYRHGEDPGGYSGVAWARISTILWSDEKADLQPLAAAIVKLVHSLDLAGQGHSTNKILLERGGYEPERGLYKRMIDAQIWFLEDI